MARRCVLLQCGSAAASWDWLAGALAFPSSLPAERRWVAAHSLNRHVSDQMLRACCSLAIHLADRGCTERLPALAGSSKAVGGTMP